MRNSEFPKKLGPSHFFGVRALKMPFGKFSGLPLADIPTNYLSWLLSLDLREPLKSAARSEYWRRVDAQGGQAVSTLDADAIKAIYRQMAFKWHPDRGGTTEAMQAVNEFYEALQ